MNRLRVTFDRQIFLLQQTGGISRYFSELIHQFRRTPSEGIVPLTPGYSGMNQHLASRDSLITSGLLPKSTQARLASLFLGFGTSNHRWRSRTHLVHHTFYDERFLKLPQGMPRISTVHDMIPELFPEYFAGENPHRAKEQFVRSSDAIICVSNTTRRDLFAVYGQLDQPVVVIPHAASEGFFQRANKSVGLPEDFFLFVGKRGGYKDFSVLLDAFSQFAAKHTSVHLICAGGGPFIQEEGSNIADCGLTERVLQSNVTDIELALMYGRAKALVFPSRYEGFGLPVVEAFASGCPVILADTDCFREVGDQAACYFRPGDTAALFDLLERLSTDTDTRSRLIRDGRLRAQDFRWSRTASLTAQVYRNVVKAPRTF